jgi:serpin B
MVKAIWIITSIVVALILIVGGFFLFKQNALPANNNPLSTEGLSNVVDANNKFAIDLYSKYKTNDGNVFFSPYSISTALAMTYEGARGQTAEEMQKVFYFPEDSNTMRNGYANLYAEINKPGKKYKLSAANALWAENDFQFLDEYFNVVDQYYNGKVTNLNFKQDSEGSRVTINNWVEDKTNDKIKDLIPSGLITPMTRLVLTNAVYFKGEWVKQFNKDDTIERDFTTDSNNVVKAFMMQRTDDESIYNYGENNILQILEMPYSGDDLSMLIILPKDNNLEDVEKAFTTDKLSDWKDELKEQRVNVLLPSFKFETKYFMAEDLAEMGMPTAFGNAADFSGMTGKMDLAISQVIHQAFVEVNEEGTEAAAATAVIMRETSTGLGGPTIPVFNANHPFIFIIQQKDTGNILFMGRVSNPTTQ